MSGGWIGVDFDGTLAHYTGWKSHEHCGDPIPLMVDRVKDWRAKGQEVRIFTARMYPYAVCLRPGEFPDYRSGASERHIHAAEAIEAIRKWCRFHLGEELPITCVKDTFMVELWDDRAFRVKTNTGEII